MELRALTDICVEKALKDIAVIRKRTDDNGRIKAVSKFKYVYLDEPSEEDREDYGGYNMTSEAKDEYNNLKNNLQKEKNKKKIEIQPIKFELGEELFSKLQMDYTSKVELSMDARNVAWLHGIYLIISSEGRKLYKPKNPLADYSVVKKAIVLYPELFTDPQIYYLNKAFASTNAFDLQWQNIFTEHCRCICDPKHYWIDKRNRINHPLTYDPDYYRKQIELLNRLRAASTQKEIGKKEK